MTTAVGDISSLLLSNSSPYLDSQGLNFLKNNINQINSSEDNSLIKKNVCNSFWKFVDNHPELQKLLKHPNNKPTAAISKANLQSKKFANNKEKENYGVYCKFPPDYKQVLQERHIEEKRRMENRKARNLELQKKSGQLNLQIKYQQNQKSKRKSNNKDFKKPKSSGHGHGRVSSAKNSDSKFFLEAIRDMDAFDRKLANKDVKFNLKSEGQSRQSPKIRPLSSQTVIISRNEEECWEVESDKSDLREEIDYGILNSEFEDADYNCCSSPIYSSRIKF